MILGNWLFGSLATPPVLFPVTYGWGDQRIVLHADGRIEGDAEGLKYALAASKGDATPDMNRAVFWLLLKELERQQPLPTPPEVTE